MRSYTLLPICMVSNIAVFVHVKALHSFFSGYIVILQIDHKEANSRRLQECVQAQGGKCWNHSFLNDVHTETTGRRSD